MGKRREPRYEARFNIGLDPSVAARIREASDRYGVAQSVIVRRAIGAGLDKALDAIRKQAAGRAETRSR